MAASVLVRHALMPAFAVLLLLAVRAAAAGDDSLITVAATDDCPAGQWECLVLDSFDGDPGANQTIRIVFENRAQDQHDLHVTPLAQADTENRSTTKAVTLGSSGTVDGADGNASFAIDVKDAQGLYFWCDRAGHEEAGLWIEQPFDGLAEPAGAEDDAPSTPAAAWLALVALGAASVLLMRRAGG